MILLLLSSFWLKGKKARKEGKVKCGSVTVNESVN